MYHDFGSGRSRLALPESVPIAACTLCFSTRTALATSVGARIRHQLDRDSDAYKLVYKQRTATERINALAKELGIERPLYRKVAQSIMFLPFFMSWTVVAMISYGFFDYESGMINVILRDMGMARVSFYDKPQWWPAILTVLRVWKGTGSGCILYLAVLVGIDPQLYEAAQIDGASRLGRIRHISLPLLTPTIILVTLLAIGHIFYGDFGMIYAIIGDSASLYPTTDVIDTYIIRALQGTVNFGMSTAVGLSQSVLGFICVFGSNWIVKKWSERRGEDYSLF